MLPLLIEDMCFDFDKPNEKERPDTLVALVNASHPKFVSCDGAAAVPNFSIPAFSNGKTHVCTFFSGERFGFCSNLTRGTRTQDHTQEAQSSAGQPASGSRM